MTNSNSLRDRPGFIRLHFLRREGERTYNIKNPIVAFEVGNGRFSPRRPEPGETHVGPCFDTEAEAKDFLFDREVNHVDHAQLIRYEEKYFLSPYFEFVVNPEARRSIQPGAPSFGGLQFPKAFHTCVCEDVLEYRVNALAAVEYKNAIFEGFLMAPFRTPSFAEVEHGVPALERVTQAVIARRKRRWAGPHKALPPDAAEFYRQAQLCLPWHDFSDEDQCEPALPEPPPTPVEEW